MGRHATALVKPRSRHDSGGTCASEDPWKKSAPAIRGDLGREGEVIAGAFQTKWGLVHRFQVATWADRSLERCCVMIGLPWLVSLPVV